MTRAAEQRRAGERERSAAGDANDREAFEVEPVRDRDDVVSPARERARGARRGQTEPGPIDVNHARAARRRDAGIGVLLETRAGESVEGEHRPAGGIAALGASDPAPVVQLQQTRFGWRNGRHGLRVEFARRVGSAPKNLRPVERTGRGGRPVNRQCLQWPSARPLPGLLRLQLALSE